MHGFLIGTCASSVGTETDTDTDTDRYIHSIEVLDNHVFIQTDQKR
jgi:hypothetical protein